MQVFANDDFEEEFDFSTLNQFLTDVRSRSK